MKLLQVLLLPISCCSIVGGFVSASVSPHFVTKLPGGYDATVGTDPSTPIQYFALPGNTCPYAQRTHICLLELGLQFDLTEVSGNPKPDWYLRINPQGKVPALRLSTKDAVIYESAICNEFLCDYAASINPEPCSLMPSDPFIRASIRLLNDLCDSQGFSQAQFTYLMNKDESKDKELEDEMENKLLAYEKALEESKGPYLLGDQFSLADIHILPFIQRLIITHKAWKGYELSSDKFPNLISWSSTCFKRESVQESSMSKEKTIEVYKRFIEIDYSFGGLNQSKKTG